MGYNIVIPDNYKDLIAPAIADKRLTDLSSKERRLVLEAISKFSQGNQEILGLVGSLNMQYMFGNEQFKPAQTFKEADIVVGNVYLIHNKLIVINAVHGQRFVGLMLTRNIELFIDCKRATLVGTFNSLNAVSEFGVEVTDCYVLHTPALGVFWGYSTNDMGENSQVHTISDPRSVSEGFQTFHDNISTNFKFFMTNNPDGKDELIFKMKAIIECDPEMSAKWFDFDAIELFHLRVNSVVRK